jgi:hypothetical protein
MAGSSPFEAHAPGVSELPYHLELVGGGDGTAGAVIASTKTASLAYACYYGALREYVGERLVLRRDDEVIASNEPRV